MSVGHEFYREAVGTRGLPGYVNRALLHQLQRDRLAGLLAELEMQHGPIAPELIEKVRQEWPAPGENAAKRRGA